MKYLFTFLIKLYQATISPFIGSRCRFYPTCSTYALECLKNHSIYRASYLSFIRICKCHPFNSGGVDLPPPKNEKEDQ